VVKLAEFQVHSKWELPADSSGFHVSASCKPAIQQRGEIICSHTLWLVLRAVLLSWFASPSNTHIKFRSLQEILP